MRSRSGAVVGLYALLALLAVPVFPHFLSPNEFTRWALAASLVERGTPEISSALPLLGPAFEDVSAKDGRVYSNKAPGAALVALPGYLLARPFVGPPSRFLDAPGSVGDAPLRRDAAAAPSRRSFSPANGRPPRGDDVSRGFRGVRAPLRDAALRLRAPPLLACARGGVPVWGLGRALPSGRPRFARSAATRSRVRSLGLAVLSEYPAAVPAGVLVLCARDSRAPARSSRPGRRGAFRRPSRRVRRRLLRRRLRAVVGARASRPPCRFPSTGLFGIGLPSPGDLLVCLRIRRRASSSSHRSFSCGPERFGHPAAPCRSGAASRSPSSRCRCSFSSRASRAGTEASRSGCGTSSAALPFLVFPFAFRRGGLLESALVGASARPSARRHSRSHSSLRDSRCPGVRLRSFSSKGD